ncbi:MAG TPA: glycine cleavage system protein GcvH [Pirellulales bacterium]
MKPENLLFAKTHEWVHLEQEAGAKVATVGISAFALEALTDLVYIELPEVGRQVKAGESFGEIESVKAVSDMYSPVTGEVIAVHKELSDKLDSLNSDPYGQGWMIKVKLSSDHGVAGLLDFEAYQQQCAEEGH